MEQSDLKILLVEDSALHRELIRSELAEASATIEVEAVETLGAGLERLSSGGFDAVLLDLVLPDSAGIDTLWRVLARAPDVPVVVLTSLDEDDLAVQAIQGGAQDYLGKDRISGDVVFRSIRHAVERKRLQLRLERRSEQLERSQRDIQQLALVAFRRLQEPIRLAEETCREFLDRHADLIDDALRARVVDTLDGLDYLRRVLEDFGTYTRVGVNRSGGPSPITDTNEVLESLREELRARFEENDVELACDRLPPVAASRDDVALVLRLLLANAVRFRGESRPRLHLSAEREAEIWRFSLSDNGVGVDPDYPGQIFEIFESLEPGADAESGTGMGLAICKRIVESYDGGIWVESEPAKGSVFHFTLPAVREGERER